MSKVVASCSNRILLHDINQSKPQSFSSATSGGTGLQPAMAFSHHQQGKISSMAWSQDNQIIASGGEDG
jgi:WD40 repeat protein